MLDAGSVPGVLSRMLEAAVDARSGGPLYQFDHVESERQRDCELLGSQAGPRPRGVLTPNV